MKKIIIRTVLGVLSILILGSFAPTSGGDLIEYIIYEYDSARLKSKEDLKVYKYVRILKDGTVQVRDENDNCTSFKVDKQFIKKFKSISDKGLDTQIIKQEHQPGTQYAGKYTYLEIKGQRACFNPYYCKVELKTVLNDLTEKILNSERSELKTPITVSNKTIELIKLTHRKSNLLPISAPLIEIISE